MENRYVHFVTRPLHVDDSHASFVVRSGSSCRSECCPPSLGITTLKIAKDELILIEGKTIRHVVGLAGGKAGRNEPSIPTLSKVAGLNYQSDFELWLPAAGGNGRFWFSVLNRGVDLGGLRNGILRRGGGYGWWHGKPRTPFP